MANFEKRIKARKLRKSGWSIGDIAKKVGIAKSTSSLWCSDIALDDEKIKILAKKEASGAYLGRLRAAENRRKERMVRMNNYAKLGEKMVGILSERDLFIAGLALYWAEGSKKERQTTIINSDVAVLNLWVDWLVRFAGLSKRDITCVVGINQIHESRIDAVMRYWSKMIGIPISQFRKPSFKKVKNIKIYENFSKHYGSLVIYARRSTNLNYQILGMIEAVRKQFEANHDKI